MPQLAGKINYHLHKVFGLMWKPTYIFTNDFMPILMFTCQLHATHMLQLSWLGIICVYIYTNILFYSLRSLWEPEFFVFCVYTVCHCMNKIIN